METERHASSSSGAGALVASNLDARGSVPDPNMHLHWAAIEELINSSMSKLNGSILTSQIALPDDFFDKIYSFISNQVRVQYFSHFLGSQEAAIYGEIVSKIKDLLSQDAGILGSPEIAEEALSVPKQLLSAASNTVMSMDMFERAGCVGTGSYGSVFVWRHKFTGIMYAVKEMSKRILKSKASVHTVVRELSCSLAVSSPYVASFDFGFVDQQNVYLGMRMMWRGDLERWLLAQPTRRFDENVARFYIAQIVLALKHLHQAGVIHRDIKASNILIDEDGHIKLTDFGLAVLMHSCSQAAPSTERICLGEMSDTISHCCLGCMQVTKLKDLQVAANDAVARGMNSTDAARFAVESLSRYASTVFSENLSSSRPNSPAISARTSLDSRYSMTPSPVFLGGNNINLSGNSSYQSVSRPPSVQQQQMQKSTISSSLRNFFLGSKQKHPPIAQPLTPPIDSPLPQHLSSSNKKSSLFQESDVDDISMCSSSHTSLSEPGFLFPITENVEKYTTIHSKRFTANSIVSPTVIMDCSCEYPHDDGTGWYKGRAGTSAYWCPQMISRDSHGDRIPYGAEADYFSLGCLTYCLMTGRSPFSTGMGTQYDNAATIEGKITWPRGIFSKEARDFITKLTAPDPSKRLGSGPQGWKDVMNHSWFAKIDWGLLASKVLPSPSIPDYRMAINLLVPPEKIEGQYRGKEAEEAARADSELRQEAARVELTAEDQAIFNSCVYTSPEMLLKCLVRSLASSNPPLGNSKEATTSQAFTDPVTLVNKSGTYSQMAAPTAIAVPTQFPSIWNSDKRET
jgi:serine/threonine protein kinase